MEHCSTQPENRQNVLLLQTKMSYFLPLFILSPHFFSPLKKIDEENEANLLAVLTETLDSIPVDEDGLPSFEALADGDVTNARDQSCPSTPDGSPRTPEPDEPSLVRDPFPSMRPLCPILFCHEAWPSHSVSFPRSFSVTLCFTLLPLSGLHYHQIRGCCRPVTKNGHRQQLWQSPIDVCAQKQKQIKLVQCSRGVNCIVDYCKKRTLSS